MLLLRVEPRFLRRPVDILVTIPTAPLRFLSNPGTRGNAEEDKVPVTGLREESRVRARARGHPPADM